MRYYCKNCLTIFDFASGTKIPVEYLEKILKKQKEMGIKDKCCVCGSFLDRLPLYETPEQYKKRTGEKFPKNAAVYALNGYSNKWRLLTYNDSEIFNTTAAVVIADPPVSPPDDWRPE